LEGSFPDANKDGIMDVIRDLGCVQFDPIRAVERTQLLVLHSRLGDFKVGDLDALLFEERRLFEYWAHAASIVLTEDFPIFWRHMRDWAPGDRPWMKRARAWMAENEELRKYILDELARSGPMAVKEFHDPSKSRWKSSGWTNGQTVRMMLNYLWEQGEILVSRRKGLTKHWDLRERCLPDWTPRDDLDWPEVVYHAAQRSLRALGVGRARHVERHFTRSNYPDLEATLEKLENDGLIRRLVVDDDGVLWPGNWYIHTDDIARLDLVESGDFQPRTSLLSPFDNLICDRKRTEELFGFHFRIEIYVPKNKRQYGYYVMPILLGDRLIGRIDPKLDRKAKRLVVHNLYAEDDAPMDVKTGRAVSAAIENLGRFLGVKEIDYAGGVPAGWRKAML
jgi:uncharacterized protein YcaQ